MKHYIEKCKKDSWKIESFKRNNPHQFVQNIQKATKMHIYVQKAII